MGFVSIVICNSFIWIFFAICGTNYIMVFFYVWNNVIIMEYGLLPHTRQFRSNNDICAEVCGLNINIRFMSIIKYNNL